MNGIKNRSGAARPMSNSCRMRGINGKARHYPRTRVAQHTAINGMGSKAGRDVAKVVGHTNASSFHEGFFARPALVKQPSGIVGNVDKLLICWAETRLGNSLIINRLINTLNINTNRLPAPNAHQNPVAAVRHADGHARRVEQGRFTPGPAIELHPVGRLVAVLPGQNPQQPAPAHEPEPVNGAVIPIGPIPFGGGEQGFQPTDNPAQLRHRQPKHGQAVGKRAGSSRLPVNGGQRMARNKRPFGAGETGFHGGAQVTARPSYLSDTNQSLIANARMFTGIITAQQPCFTSIRGAALLWWCWLVAMLTAVSLPGSGQSCAGASGEVIISETFGTGGTRPSLTGRTTYTLVPNPCPIDGQYTILSSTPDSCFSYLWHALPADHTPGDANGNFLVVNASEKPGEFYSQAVAGLCSGTQYEFSVWGLNMLKPGICSRPLVPDVAIRIETAAGVLVQTVDVGRIGESATSVWQRYATLFTVPANTDGVVVKLINKQGEGGCGNDLALDDIQLTRCGACPPTPVFLPDVFTPNNDGLNDTLTVLLRDAQAFSLTIYDRWGSVVFVSDAVANTWDGRVGGKPGPAGAYTWLLHYQRPGANNTPDTFTHTGRVLLLR